MMHIDYAETKEIHCGRKATNLMKRVGDAWASVDAPQAMSHRQAEPFALSPLQAWPKWGIQQTIMRQV